MGGKRDVCCQIPERRGCWAWGVGEGKWKGQGSDSYLIQRLSLQAVLPHVAFPPRSCYSSSAVSVHQGATITSGRCHGMKYPGGLILVPPLNWHPVVLLQLLTPSQATASTLHGLHFFLCLCVCVRITVIWTSWGFNRWRNYMLPVTQVWWKLPVPYSKDYRARTVKKGQSISSSLLHAIKKRIQISGICKFGGSSGSWLKGGTKRTHGFCLWLCDIS